MSKTKSQCFAVVAQNSIFSHCFQLMTTNSPYLSMITKKRSWQAVPVNDSPVKDGARPTLMRALSLRHIELPVKTLLEQGLHRDLPSTPGVIEALRSNQKDEERHDEALNYVAKACGTDEQAEAEVMNILNAWMEHPAHPIHKVAIVERSIFFVALPFSASMETWQCAQFQQILAAMSKCTVECMAWWQKN